MKLLRNISLLFIITVFTVSYAAAQESDHRIVSEFNAEFDSLEQQLTMAATIEEVDTLKQRIKQLKAEYGEYSELINNSIYPATFEDEVEKLRFDVLLTEQRFLVIENQREKLSEFTDQIAGYRTEINRMNTRTDSLQQAIAASQESEERLSNLVRNYRESLESRDKLVMQVVDSLLITYKDMSASEMNELAGEVQSGRIANSGNPLDIISTMIEDNIQFASANTQSLTVEDHLRMYAVQHRFSEVWNQIGSQMIIVYGGDDKAKWENTIESKIKDWRMTTSRNMWESMDNYLEFSEVELEAFDNNYSFFVALDTFVKEAQEESKNEIISSESYEDYKKFQEFWSGKIKNEWSNLVQDAEVLTVAQISTIDQQLDSWENQSRPIHPMLIVLLVFMGVALIGFVLVMFKSKRT